MTKEKRLQSLLRRLMIGAASVAAFIVIWYIVAWIDKESVVVYPHNAFVALLSSFVAPIPWRGFAMQQEIVSSLGRLFWGFLLAFALAVPLGLLIGYSWIANVASKPIIEVLRPIPPLAWLPVFVVVFRNDLGPVMVVFLGIFFPVLLAVIFGVRSVPRELVEAARTLGANKLAIFKKVIFPSTVPYMMNGIYTGLGVGWMCIVAAEMMGVRGGGLGELIFSAGSSGNYDVMYAAMVMLGVLGFLTTEMARVLSQEVRRWMGMKAD
jgi:ABC-type nitrate/sulfonate/bicarbonate transport system permease component